MWSRKVYGTTSSTTSSRISPSLLTIFSSGGLFTHFQIFHWRSQDGRVVVETRSFGKWSVQCENFIVEECDYNDRCNYWRRIFFRYFLEESIQESKQHSELGFITFTAFLTKQKDKTIVKVCSVAYFVQVRVVLTVYLFWRCLLQITELLYCNIQSVALWLCLSMWTRTS